MSARKGSTPDAVAGAAVASQPSSGRKGSGAFTPRRKSSKVHLAPPDEAARSEAAAIAEAVKAAESERGGQDEETRGALVTREEAVQQIEAALGQPVLRARLKLVEQAFTRTGGGDEARNLDLAAVQRSGFDNYLTDTVSRRFRAGQAVLLASPDGKTAAALGKPHGVSLARSFPLVCRGLSRSLITPLPLSPQPHRRRPRRRPGRSRRRGAPHRRGHRRRRRPRASRGAHGRTRRSAGGSHRSRL